MSEDKRRPRRPRRRKRPKASAHAKAEPRPRVQKPVIDTSKPADEPLSRDEIDDFRRHLAFIRKYRSVLRPKLNAKEDLLIAGSHPIEHRGTCQHLLSKINATAVRAALQREPVQSNLPARVEFLAGAAGISGDVGVLLLFLEALGQVGSKDETSRAFARAVATIDLTGLSPARMSRLLDVMQTAFGEHELPGALFGLLQNHGFREAFDATSSELKPDVAALFVPLRALHRALPIRGKSGRKPRRKPKINPNLAEGLRIMLSAPPAMLSSYTVAVRQQILQLVLNLDEAWTVGHPGVLTLLKSLSKRPGSLHEDALKYAQHLVRSGAYKQALGLLRDFEKAPTQLPGVDQLISQLARPRVGPMAVEDKAVADRVGLQGAYWLGTLSPVLVRWEPTGATSVLSTEAEIQADLCLPGVADVLGQSSPEERRAWVAVPATRARLDTVMADRSKKLTRTDVLHLARCGVRIFRALGLAGVELPDADPRRFVVARDRGFSDCLLADFGGAKRIPREEAEAVSARLAAKWCIGALSWPPFKGRAPRKDIGDRLVDALRELVDAGAKPVAFDRALRLEM